MPSGVIVQYFSAICVNFIAISYGITIGWTSPSLMILMSEHSPLETGPVTIDEASWIGSIMCLGGVTGTLVFGLTVDNFGRRVSLLILAIPEIISWLFIWLGETVLHLYLSRFLGGLAGGGLFVVIPLFISEISEDKVRGQLGSFLLLSCNFGILIGFIFGEILNYKTFPLIVLIFPVFYFLTTSFFPETPKYLFSKNQLKLAELSLRFYRGYNKQTEIFSTKYLQEFEELKIYNKFDETTSIDSNNANKLTLGDFTNKAALKALVIGVTLFLLTQFCGVFTMLNYTATIFEQAGSSLSPNVSSIIIAFIQLIGSYVSTILIDRAGRKILLIFSSFATGGFWLIMGGYIYMQHHKYDVTSYTWIPVVSLSGVVFTASIAISTLAFVILAEILPQKIRGIISTFALLLLWLAAFLMVKYFVILMEILGMYICIWMFAGACFFCGLFTIIMLPETKGKSIETIVALLGG